MTDRTQHIADFFEANMNRFSGDNLELKVLPVTRPNWTIAPDRDPTNLHAPFGFLTPVISLGDWVFVFCPEIIAEQTEQLDDDDFLDYLLFITTHVNLHLEYFDQPDEVAEPIIDSTLYNLSPRTMGIVNRVQLRTLDATS